MKKPNHRQDSGGAEKESPITGFPQPDVEYEGLHVAPLTPEFTNREESCEPDVEGPASEDNLLPFDDRLITPVTAQELEADNHAIYSAGLTPPEEPDADAAPGEEHLEATGNTQEDIDPVAGGQSAARHRDRPTWKGRPRRKKGDGLLGIPHLLSAAIWLVIILTIGISIGRVIWVCAADVLAFGREDRTVTIAVTERDSMDSIARKLHEAGLIRYPKLFLLYADLSNADKKITTGTFTLNTLYDYHALVSQMTPRSSNRVVVEDVLIPEGFTCRQIFALLDEKGICSVSSLESWAAEGELKDYWFLEGVERGNKYCLEGYLFPDTYDFYENSTPKQALEKMLNGFEYRFSEEMQAQLPVLNEKLAEMMRKDGRSEEYIQKNRLDLHGLLTVASLIEKETASNSESPKIASVIYNRLYGWGSTPRYLNIDATIIYALNGKSNLTPEDMTVDSPFNTYTNTGLTPGPIASPGLASIKAALSPEDTEFFYYVLDTRSDPASHHFSKTYEEHVNFIASLEGKHD